VEGIEVILMFLQGSGVGPLAQPGGPKAWKDEPSKGPKSGVENEYVPPVGDR
jgi:hypothetical protein